MWICEIVDQSFMFVVDVCCVLCSECSSSSHLLLSLSSGWLCF